MHLRVHGSHMALAADKLDFKLAPQATKHCFGYQHLMGAQHGQHVTMLILLQ